MSERNITMHCHAELDETNEHGNPEVCDTELSEEEHGKFINNPYGEDRFGNDLQDRFEMGCIRLTCPECDTVHHACNMCHDADGAKGYYRGDSTGKMLACDNCNAREAVRQRRDPHFDGGRWIDDQPGIPDGPEDVAPGPWEDR